MANEQRLEDAFAIRAILHRLLLGNERVTLAHKQNRREFPILALEENRICLSMDHRDLEAWKIGPEDKLAVSLEDRGFKYEAVTTSEGPGSVEEMPCLQVVLPRTLRRSDTNRLVHFAPDVSIACTFTNARSALLDGVVKGMGREGVELVLRDGRQKIGDFFRVGEESTLDLPLDGGLRLTAPTKVAYLDEQKVGLRFTEKVDGDLLGRYRTWLDGQQRLQAQRDREEMESGGTRALRRSTGPEFPLPRLLVDRDPLILVVTEQEEFAKRLSEGLGRKFGFLRLDHIKGRIRPQVKTWGGEEGAPSWDRLRLVIVHNRLRLASPLELCRQLVEEEGCPLPVVLAGGEEDLELKRNRALSAGAVDYLPVEPFRILALLKQLDETLRMFA